MRRAPPERERRTPAIASVVGVIVAGAIVAGATVIGAGVPVTGGELSGEEPTHAAPGEGADSEPFGPLPLSALHPLTNPFHEPVPDTPRTLAPGRLSVSVLSQYGSVQRREDKGGNLAIFDGEFHRVAVGFRYGLLERLEARLEIPFAMRTSGFLDDAIRSYHNITGLLRDRRMSDQFDELLLVDGERVVESDQSGYRLLDIPLQLKYRIFEQPDRPFDLAVRASVEFPSGSESDWLGNGGVDGAVGILLEHTAGDMTFTLNGDYGFVSRSRRFRSAGIGLRPVPYGMASIEWRAFERASLHFQVTASGDYFKGTHRVDTLDNPQVQFAVGAHFDVTDRVQGFAGLAEDILSGSSPDVVFFLGFRADLDVASLLAGRKGR